MYKAEDLELDRIIAVKILHPMLASDEHYVNLLKREVVVASQITHPNIVRVFDVASLHNSPVITMAFIQGENLASVLRRDGALSTPRVVHFGLQICSGLEEAHRCGVVHRDLKPQNLLIDHQSQIFISDFGLAQAASAGNHEAIETSNRPGTLRYMSPEQFHGLPCDPRSDLFSFGLVLYEMLTGTALEVDHDATGQIAIDRKTGLPARLPETVPGPLAKIALRCLSQRRVDRYQSASEIFESFPRDLFTGNYETVVQSDVGQPSTGAAIAWDGLRTRPRIEAVAGLALIAGVGILTLWNSHVKASSPSFDQLFREASSELLNNDDAHSLERAATLFQSAARLKGTEPVYEGLAKAEFRLYELEANRQQLNEAESAIQMAEKLNVTSRAAALLHAQIDIANQAPASAVTRLNRVLASGRPSDEILRPLAEAQFLSGRSSEALDTWQRAVDLNPNYWRNHNGFGAMLMQVGQPGKAEAAFRKVIQLNPDSYVGYSNLGAAYISSGEFQKAIAVTNKSLAIHATAKQYNNLGTALYYTGSCHAAIQLFLKAVELSPHSEIFAGNLGEAYRCTGDSVKAKAAYGNALQLAQDALRETPNDARLLSRLSLFLAKAGHIDAGMRILSSALAGSPGNPEVLYSQALMCVVKSQYSEGASAVRAALDHGYSLRVAASDPELRPLWTDADLKNRFEAELSRVRQSSSEARVW